MTSFIYWALGYEEEVVPDQRQVELRSLLMKQVKKSEVLLKPLLKRETVEDKLRAILQQYARCGRDEDGGYNGDDDVDEDEEESKKNK